jgi:hypothetical protein
VTVRPDMAETLTSRGMALVFEVEDICGISCILVSLLIYCSKNEEHCLYIASLECLRHIVSYINSLIMEAILTFTSALSLSTITLELQAQINEAIAALPPSHCRLPLKGEVVESPAAGYA